jgi:SAM-dependent methyltransferase
MSLSETELATIAAYEETAEDWAKQHSQPLFPDEMTEFHSLLPAGRILEIGAGSGIDAAELIKLGYDYLGTEPSANNIAWAQRANPTGRFDRKSVYDLAYDEPFDGFWCAAVLLHIPRVQVGEALETIHRNMKSKAIGFIAIKEGEGEEVIFSPEDSDKNPRTFFYWETGAFKKELASTGYSVLSEGYRSVSQRTRWLTYLVSCESLSK